MQSTWNDNLKQELWYSMCPMDIQMNWKTNIWNYYIWKSNWQICNYMQWEEYNAKRAVMKFPIKAFIWFLSVKWLITACRELNLLATEMSYRHRSHHENISVATSVVLYRMCGLQEITWYSIIKTLKIVNTNCNIAAMSQVKTDFPDG